MGKCIYCGEPAGFLRSYHPECAAKMEEKRKNAELDRRNELKKQEEIQDHYYKVENEYRALMEKHYKLTEKIGQLYSVASNLFAVDGPEMQKVIDLCLEDIALLPKFQEACKEQAKARKAYIALVYKNDQNTFEMPPVDYWESYKRLAIIYEKQKRWEDAEGNVYSKRVGTMVQRYTESTPDWVNDATYPILYGNITSKPEYKPYMRIQVEERYTLNSKGKSVPIQEVGWAEPGEAPTHMVLQFTSSHGGAYIGSPGNTFWIDNVELIY